MPRLEEGLGTECVLDVPVETMAGKSFQENLVRLPIRLRGFGLRSLADTTLTAFIGGVELALGGEQVGGGWWRELLDEDKGVQPLLGNLTEGGAAVLRLPAEGVHRRPLHRPGHRGAVRLGGEQ